MTCRSGSHSPCRKHPLSTGATPSSSRRTWTPVSTGIGSSFFMTPRLRAAVGLQCATTAGSLHGLPIADSPSWRCPVRRAKSVAGRSTGRSGGGWGVTARGGGEVEVLLNTLVDLPLRLWVGSEPTRIALPGRRPGVLRCPRLPGAIAGRGLDPRTGRHRRGAGGRGAGGAALWRTGWGCCRGTPIRGCRCDARRPAGAAAAGSARCWEELVGYV